jgi:hypothetical protein
MERMGDAVSMAFLHHSTGHCIWRGGVPEWFDKYNADHKTSYQIREVAFPKKDPYGWANYPYDCWNIWVKNAGPEPFKQEPTLEMLTKEHQVIIFKHCFPVSSVQPDADAPDVSSDRKTVGNYKLQYEALKRKLHEFPRTRFIVWTGAALVNEQVSEAGAQRAREFFDWVRTTWDEKGDNIFLWDFYQLETDGSIYMKDEYASSPGDSHPNKEFSARVAPLFCQRAVDVIEGRADATSLTGQPQARR